ncbi:hypothetical protein J8F10_03815 [Gemmata sp. G18]|uniref:Uncharacterized protein n=1 Tax=Gemmata palustris TaxID=2822762 RepID=A0ABS5BL43_9BACT|nr:hypothetical protein [Gemmata palustris]MBP3954416.1 hypothetical protein [Gemmata palustris]
MCHLLSAFGFPLLGSSPKKGDVPFPCQSRPCGCLTADECWKGDCCCFTLEEKLHWAGENGIVPPAHVRPLVEARKARPAPPLKKKKSCCSEAASPPEVPGACAAETVADCSQCAAKPSSNCRERKAPSEDRASGVRWVIGVHAKKCRGDGPAGLFLLDPGIASDPALPVFPEPERSVHPAPRSDRAGPTSHRPPTPPPRPF